ncbi:MAG TPA: serine hydrolase [Acidimicrobiales bacterium]|nr:serine hydrolase [Acidimicrobiales bacterium]
MRDEIERVAEASGARVWLHARNLDGENEMGIDADAPVVLASTFKIPVLIELARQSDAGRVSLTDRIAVPASRRTDGPTGLSVMLDDANLSVRDLAFLMMSVSDNTATDVLMELLGGAERINATMKEIGSEETHLLGDCKFLLDDLGAQLGDGPPRACPALEPSGTNRSTPRAMTRLLAMIWHDEAASADACAAMRRIMGLQVWPHRLTSGFGDGVTLSAKTGTLPGIRNEAGVIEFADGGRYAVAVYTRARSFDSRLPAVDAAIGTIARLAIEALNSD